MVVRVKLLFFWFHDLSLIKQLEKIFIVLGFLFMFSVKMLTKVFLFRSIVGEMLLNKILYFFLLDWA